MSKTQNWIFRIAAVFLPILLFVMTPAVGLWATVVRSGQVAMLIKATLSNDSAREGLSAQLTDSIISGLDEKARAEAEPQRDELAAAISARLADKDVQAKFAGIATTVFDAVTTGAQEVSLDPTPLADEFVAAINSIPALGKVSREDLDDIKPVKLGGSEDPLPNLSPIVGGLRGVAIATFLLSILGFVAIGLTSRTPLRGLAIPLLSVGAIWSAIIFIGLQILQQQLEPGTQLEVIPAVANNLLFGLKLIAILLVLAGVILLTTHLVLKRREAVEPKVTT